MSSSSDETKLLVGRLMDLVREIEAWVERGGTRWWLQNWLKDVRYLADRVEQQDEIDRLEEERR